MELGERPERPYQGKPEPPAEEVRLVFELLRPKKTIRTHEVDGKEVQVADSIGITIAKKLGDKTKFKKIFDLMHYGRDGINHIAQRLGNEFIVTVFHNDVEEDRKKQIYASLNDSSGTYDIGAPVVIDPITEETRRTAVPAHIRPLQLFLFDISTKEIWDSLFIDGSEKSRLVIAWSNVPTTDCRKKFCPQ